MFVGVDVSKDTLDVYRPDTGENIKKPKHRGQYQRPLQGVEEEKRSCCNGSDSWLLGELNRGEVAKLVGVAPINRDSGKIG